MSIIVFTYVWLNCIIIIIQPYLFIVEHRPLPRVSMSSILELEVVFELDGDLLNHLSRVLMVFLCFLYRSFQNLLCPSKISYHHKNLFDLSKIRIILNNILFLHLHKYDYQNLCSKLQQTTEQLNTCRKHSIFAFSAFRLCM